MLQKLEGNIGVLIGEYIVVAATYILMGANLIPVFEEPRTGKPLASWNPNPTPTPTPTPNPNPNPNPTLPLTRRGQPYWRHGFPHTGGLHALGAQGGASGVDSERALVRVAVGALTSSEVRITVIV